MSGMMEVDGWQSVAAADDPEMEQVIAATHAAKDAAKDAAEAARVDQVERSIDLTLWRGLLGQMYAARGERDRLLSVRRDLDKLLAALGVEDIDQALALISNWEPVQ